MTNESNRVQVSFTKVLRSRPFGRGFASYRRGEPFEPEAYPRLNDQWNYERGRMFAAFYDGALKINRRLSTAAIVAGRHALHSGALI